MRRSLALILIAAAAGSSCAKAVRVREPAPPAPSAVQTLIPVPARVESAPGTFVVTPDTRIVVTPGDDRVFRIGRYLSDLIGLAAGLVPPRVEAAGAAAPAGAIQLALGTLPSAGEEGYELAVTPEGVTIVANEPAGLFYGVQTFRQLLPPWVDFEAIRPDKRRTVSAPAVGIADSPRFGWRGAMLDVARHFLTADEVKRYIDLIALYKLNRLHLHLSDDQGWRIEIKSWPELTRKGAATEVGGGPGGYYTQEQFADLVTYAKDRFVTIVPEIDMPGHTNAALASYPELNCDGVARQPYTGIEVGFSALCVEREITYQFIDDVVREIGALADGPYFHAGGDEVKTLTPQQYIGFIDRVQGIVRVHGKQMIGWDEIAQAGLLPTTIVQHWRPKAFPADAAAKGIRVIVSPADRAYVDMKYDEQTPIGLNWAGYVSVRHGYEWDPAALVANVPESAIAGVEAPLWAETLASIRDVEYLAFPRLPAIAEIGWSPRNRREWDDFRVRLGAQAPRWAALGINYYRAPEVPWR